MAGWISSYLAPAVSALAEEDLVLYGTVTRATVPSVFGGTNIPFFDKVNFQINEDENANFVLYASQEMLDEMSEWFSFGAVNAGTIPLEIQAARVKGNTFVVHSLSSSNGDLDFETLTMDYQVYYAFIFACLVAGLLLVGIILLILWFAIRRRV